MPAPLNVDPELLALSAARADAESQRLFAGHSAADAAVESALFGWVGGSHAALGATAARWAEATARLSITVYGHGEALRVSGLTFAGMDDEHAGLLSGPPAP